MYANAMLLNYRDIKMQRLVLYILWRKRTTLYFTFSSGSPVEREKICCTLYVQWEFCHLFFTNFKFHLLNTCKGLCLHRSRNKSLNSANGSIILVSQKKVCVPTLHLLSVVEKHSFKRKKW